MSKCNEQIMLQHTITRTPDGYRVVIWEPTPVQEEGLEVFLWKIALTVASLNEAKTVIKIYSQLLDSNTYSN